MKHLLIIIGVIASFMIINGIESNNIQSINQAMVNACTIDMQHNPDLICD